MAMNEDPIDLLCVNTIRTLSMDAVEKANSGHPGAPMGLAPLAYVLYTRVMRHNPANADWPGRDRFVLSAGHASMLLYSMLYLTGYPLTLEDIKNFRQVGSPLMTWQALRKRKLPEHSSVDLRAPTVTRPEPS